MVRGYMRFILDCSCSSALIVNTHTSADHLPPPLQTLRLRCSSCTVLRLLFSDASEERFKILLLYFPAVVMSFVTASVFTILFALLDGEMKITVTPAGQFRLGVLSWVVVMMTFWFSNQVTPMVLEYLDLGQPTLMRGECPICASPVSCLFTGAARIRDERKCGMCGSVVGFNRKWSKVYLVSSPGARKFQHPD